MSELSSEQIVGPPPAGWRYATLEEVCRAGGGNIQTGPFGSQLHAADYVPVGIPSIMPVNIGDNRVIEDGIARITEAEAIRLSRHRVSLGDIVYSRRGDVERRALITNREEGWLCGTGCLRVRLGPKGPDPKFVSYYLGDPRVREWIVRHAHGATMPNLNTSILGACPVLLPPTEDQAAIAELLGYLDSKIGLNRRMSDTLESMARGLFKSWFVDNDACLSVSKATIQQLADLNPEVWTSSTRPKQIRYVDLSGTKWGRIDSITEYESDDAPSRAQRVLRRGDTVVGTVRPGNGSYALIHEDGLTGSTGFAVLRPKRPYFREFIYLAVTSSDNIANLAHLADGGAYPAVRPEVVAATPVMVPEDTALTRFSSLASPLLDRCAIAEKESAVLAEMRDLLVPKLISGELRIKDAKRMASAVGV